MATSNTEMTPPAQTVPAEAAVKAAPRKTESILDKVLKVLSSVRFGLIMLSLLLLCCLTGMLVMQVNVQGFEKYYQQITPAQRLVFGALGFFDIYHVWYFNLLLAVTGLNIILASIDRFPAAWQYVIKPKLKASPKFISAQMFSTQAEFRESPQTLAERVRAAWRRRGFRARVSEEDNRITVFAQKSVWNRLGAYAVHVGLLTIFTGGFLTAKYARDGVMEIEPGMKPKNKYISTVFSPEGKPQIKEADPLPFYIECRDLQQKLIDPDKGLDAGNTIDWLSSITIVDGDVRKEMLVHLNNVGDYEGYRFFQSQFMPKGNARQVSLTFRPVEGGQPVQLKDLIRNGTAAVEGIGAVSYVDFASDYMDAGSTEYSNPAALVEVAAAGSEPQRVIAFSRDALANLEQFGKEEVEKAQIEVGGKKYQVVLDEFEKAATTHSLTIQYDPGRTPVYIGFTILVIALCGVFFFSHQRMWAVIEPDGKGSKAYFGGHTNRNRPAFEGRFNALVESVTGGGSKDE